MNIVVLAGYYYPYFSPNGNCINNVINELKKEHTVTVIAEKNKFSLLREEQADGVRIIRIDDYLTCVHSWAEDKKYNSKNIILKKFYNYILQTKRVIFTLKGIFRTTAIDKQKIKRYYNAIEKLSSEENIDLIIPVILPIESVLAAIKLKVKLKCNIIPFQFDHFTEGVTINKFKFLYKMRYKKHIQIKKYILRNVDNILILPQLQIFYQKECFKEFNNKIILSEHPLFKNKTQIEGCCFESNKINMVFTGTLSKLFRRPEYYFELINKSDIKYKIVAHMYVAGDCEIIINNYRKILQDSICNHGYVPLSQAISAMNGADILVSIGVTEGNQVSGKIFDYFSTGKPIIHFYYLEDDPNIKYLNQYPLAKCMKIKSDISNDDIIEFEEFCNSVAGKIIDFEELYKIYYYATPKCITEQIISSLEN